MTLMRVQALGFGGFKDLGSMDAFKGLELRHQRSKPLRLASRLLKDPTKLLDTCLNKYLYIYICIWLGVWRSWPPPVVRSGRGRGEGP